MGQPFTLTELKDFYINHVFFQFEIIITVSVSSFEYLCSRSTAIILFFILSVRGSPLDVRFWRLQTSDSDFCSRCPRFKDWLLKRWWMLNIVNYLKQVSGSASLINNIYIMTAPLPRTLTTGWPTTWAQPIVTTHFKLPNLTWAWHYLNLCFFNAKKYYMIIDHSKISLILSFHMRYWIP